MSPTVLGVRRRTPTSAKDVPKAAISSKNFEQIVAFYPRDAPQVPFDDERWSLATAEGAGRKLRSAVVVTGELRRR